MPQISAVDVAVMMALFKIARIATGVQKDDSWIDAAGYIACGAEIAASYEAGEEKTPSPTEPRIKNGLSCCPMCGCENIEYEGGERSCTECGAVWSELHRGKNIEIRIISYGPH